MAALDIFDRDPYTVLGMAQDAPSSEVAPAHAKAMRADPRNARKLQPAMLSLQRPARRLALDVFVLAPQVPASVLDKLLAGEDAGVSIPPVDVAEALLVVQDVLPLASVAAPSLAFRQDLARTEPVLAPDIEM
jgi:hypothetical protein